MPESATIKITASDISGQKKEEFSDIPSDASIKEVVEKMVSEMNIPRNDPNGNSLSYQAFLDRQGRHLNPSEIVSDTLEQDDSLVLHPRINAG